MGINEEYSKDRSLLKTERSPDSIKVRAIISCPTCSYKKSFRNQFLRKDMELMTVALKVFDWLVCDKCGELLSLNLEFEI